MERDAEPLLPPQVQLQGSIEAWSELSHALALIGIPMASSQKLIVVGECSSAGLEGMVYRCSL